MNRPIFLAKLVGPYFHPGVHPTQRQPTPTLRSKTVPKPGQNPETARVRSPDSDPSGLGLSPEEDGSVFCSGGSDSPVWCTWGNCKSPDPRPMRLTGKDLTEGFCRRVCAGRKEHVHLSYFHDDFRECKQSHVGLCWKSMDHLSDKGPRMYATDT